MSAVCVLLQQPTDWSTVKHSMAEPLPFLKALTSFDRNNVPDKVSYLSPLHYLVYIVPCVSGVC